MKRTVLSLAALALLPAVANSAEPAPLDEEFLEYLSEYEGQSDNWTWFADDEATKNAAKDKEVKPVTPAKPVTEVKK